MKRKKPDEQCTEQPLDALGQTRADAVFPPGGAGVLYMLARNLDWGEVRQSLSDYSTRTLLVGFLITCASYLAFSCYDLLGRKYSRHHLPARQVMPVAMVCYAFNLNFTTWIGG